MSSQILSPTTETLHHSYPQHHTPLQPTYNLDDLVSDIKAHLGDSNGIGSEDIDAEHLISLARKYISDPADWVQYFHNDPSKNYTRNAIKNINKKANILLLVWNPEKGSPIHDHANAHCIMKVLAGELTETVYYSPDNGEREEGGAPLKIKSSNTHRANDVAYISDEIGLHRVHNPSSGRIAVSLHLYTPPNAADYGYNIFDERTGKASYVPQARAFLRRDGQ